LYLIETGLACQSCYFLNTTWTTRRKKAFNTKNESIDRGNVKTRGYCQGFEQGQFKNWQWQIDTIGWG
jgi:hypothetical protein